MVELNAAGVTYAHGLISAGKVDKASGWSFSAEDGDALLGPKGDDWANYAKHHLGVDPAAPADTKAHYKYPFAKGDKVYRAGLIAVRQRAGQESADAIYAAAGRLVEEIDGTGKAAQGMMTRGYSVLKIKSMSDGDRVIEGIASTPTPDRYGDIVEPMGAKFKLPMPLLWQHQNSAPVGTVEFAAPNADGIPFRASIANVTEPGTLKDRLDEAWQSVKAGLVRAVSIGFVVNSYEIMKDGGYRYTDWEWLELSLVTIPANADATIQNIRAFDTVQRAATGTKQDGVTTKTKTAIAAAVVPGASGVAKPVSLRGTSMKTLAERIREFEAARAAKSARMVEIMSNDSGETLDVAGQEEFDNLEAEMKAIDDQLKRLSAAEKLARETAKPVDVDTSAVAVARAAGRTVPAQVRAAEVAPGIRFARFAKVKAVARLEHENVRDVAARMYGKDSETYAVVTKAGEVAEGSNLSGNWASALTGAETQTFADFVNFLRPATILGKFGANGVPALRRVPFREPLISQTGGGAGYWVGEGKPKPVTAFDFSRTTLVPLKVANIAVLTEENIRSSAPSSEMIVRDSIRDALVAVQDTTFVDPTNAGTSGVKPASITNGAPAIVSTGTTADHVRLDVRSVFEKFIAADNPPENGVWLMSTTNALALTLMLNALGQREFPGMSMMGGTLEGIPVIASRYCGSNVTLVNASDIYEGDDGDVVVDMSREASIEMKDDSHLTQDSTSETGSSLVSLWQSNLVGLRAERTINWKARRASAVAYLTSVTWGGAVAAS